MKTDFSQLNFLVRPGVKACSILAYAAILLSDTR